MLMLLKHWETAEIDFSKHFYGNVGSLNIPRVNQGIFNHREERQREVKRSATFDIDPVRVNLAWMVGANSCTFPKDSKQGGRREPKASHEVSISKPLTIPLRPAQAEQLPA
jgi:hypothetical protein